MRSKVAAVSFIVLAGAVARDNRASACGTANTDTDTADLQIFLCQGNPNPLLDPITGQVDPRSSIFFASNGRGFIQPQPSCTSALQTPLTILMTPLTILPMVPPADCSKIPCPDPNAIQQTGNSQWSFFIQDNDRFHLDNNEWNGNGKSDTAFYDPNSPYSKMLNMAYLVWFGLKDVDTQFHGTTDYVNLVRANDSDQWHSEFFRNVRQTEAYDGFWEGNVGDDELWLGCHEFDSEFQGVNNNIVFRLGTTIHESWHAWENWWTDRGSAPHLGQGNLPECQPPNPPCNCGSNMGDSCDRFTPHNLNAYRPFGNLWTGTSVGPGCPLPGMNPSDCVGTHLNKHSPNQIKWEYMCDLLTSPADWVTVDLLAKAQDAIELTQGTFVQLEGVQCAGNHPMMAPM